MRRTLLYFVLGLFTFTEIGAFITFWVNRNIDVFLILAVPSIALYHITCYLFPTKRGGVRPLLVLLRSFLHPPK